MTMSASQSSSLLVFQEVSGEIFGEFDSQADFQEAVPSSLAGEAYYVVACTEARVCEAE
ncbi:WD repeat containing protein [Corchorus olitorius]|uniref:WD repeat containing protein n=1 Tax=Corchorus olitorius TaxID=93759 RepID=A0A1R3K4P5_9ROSI|nr:WD repeat containing protein [Corchorus olitorius]